MLPAKQQKTKTKTKQNAASAAPCPDWCTVLYFVVFVMIVSPCESSEKTVFWPFRSVQISLFSGADVSENPL